MRMSEKHEGLSRLLYMRSGWSIKQRIWTTFFIHLIFVRSLCEDCERGCLWSFMVGTPLETFGFSPTLRYRGPNFVDHFCPFLFVGMRLKRMDVCNSKKENARVYWNYALQMENKDNEKVLFTKNKKFTKRALVVENRS